MSNYIEDGYFCIDTLNGYYVKLYRREKFPYDFNFRRNDSVPDPGSDAKYCVLTEEGISRNLQNRRSAWEGFTEFVEAVKSFFYHEGLDPYMDVDDVICRADVFEFIPLRNLRTLPIACRYAEGAFEAIRALHRRGMAHTAVSDKTVAFGKIQGNLYTLLTDTSRFVAYGKNPLYYKDGILADPFFLAPEALTYRPFGYDRDWQKADVFSLGVLLLCIFTNGRYREDFALSPARQLLDAGCINFPEQRDFPFFDRELKDLIADMLHKDAWARPNIEQAYDRFRFWERTACKDGDFSDAGPTAEEARGRDRGIPFLGKKRANLPKEMYERNVRALTEDTEICETLFMHWAKKKGIDAAKAGRESAEAKTALEKAERLSSETEETIHNLQEKRVNIQQMLARLEDELKQKTAEQTDVDRTDYAAEFFPLAERNGGFLERLHALCQEPIEGGTEEEASDWEAALEALLSEYLAYTEEVGAKIALLAERKEPPAAEEILAEMAAREGSDLLAYLEERKMRNMLYTVSRWKKQSEQLRANEQEIAAQTEKSEAYKRKRNELEEKVTRLEQEYANVKSDFVVATSANFVSVFNDYILDRENANAIFFSAPWTKALHDVLQLPNYKTESNLRILRDYIHEQYSIE